MSDIQQAEKHKAQGNEFFSQKKYHEAAHCFTEAIDLNSENHVYYSNRSACYANLGEYDKALVDAQICVDLNPEWAKGYLRRGLAEFYLGKYEQAEVSYKRGLEIEPNNSQILEGLQNVKEKLANKPAGGSADKEKFFQQALSQLKSNPETADFLNDAEFLKKIDAIKNNPQKAGEYMNDPKIQKAFEVLQKGFKGKGQNEDQNSQANAEAEKNKGNEAYKSKDFEKAIQHYEKAIQLNPNEPAYYNNKAAAYLELKNPDKAIESCNKAIEIYKSPAHSDAPKLAKALARKASAYALKQNYDEAISFYKQSLAQQNDPYIQGEIDRLEKLK